MLARDPAIKMLIVSGAYMTAILIGTDITKVWLSPVNPAIAASLIFCEITMGHFHPNLSFIFVVFAYGGALLAVILYELVYKKAVDLVEADEQDVASSDID